MFKLDQSFIDGVPSVARYLGSRRFLRIDFDIGLIERWYQHCLECSRAGDIRVPYKFDIGPFKGCWPIAVYSDCAHIIFDHCVGSLDDWKYIEWDPNDITKLRARMRILKANSLFDAKTYCRRALRSQLFNVGGVMANCYLDTLEHDHALKICLLEHNNTAVACALINDGTVNVFVLKEYRRQGFGSAVVNHLIQTYSLDETKLDCAPGNNAGVMFFKQTALNIKYPDEIGERYAN